MLNLKSTDVIRVTCGTAVTIECTVAWVDLLAAAATQGVPDRTITPLNTTSANQTICGSPTGSPDTRRNVREIVIHNVHASSSVVVKVEFYDGTNTGRLGYFTLLAGEKWVFGSNGIPIKYTAQDEQYATVGVSVDPRTNDFRLSGVSATPVMTADSTSLSTVYMAQYKGNRIALYNGTTWDLLIPPSEVSLAVTGRTTDLPFDVFAYNNGGTVTLEFLDWTNSTTRATGLTRIDGVWTKTGASTRRYMGSIRARSSTTFHHVMAGTEAGAAKIDLFNADNRVLHQPSLISTVNTWTYTTATWRQANADADLQIEVMVGLQEEFFEADLMVCSANSTTSIARRSGIGYDSTTAFTGLAGGSSGPANIETQTEGKIQNLPAIGRHYYAWLEYSTATGTCTWYGDNGALLIQSGMTAKWMC